MKHIPFSPDAKDIFVHLAGLNILKIDVWKKEKSSMPVDLKRFSERMRSLEHIQYCY
jgi:hypothetical protein